MGAIKHLDVEVSLNSLAWPVDQFPHNAKIPRPIHLVEFGGPHAFTPVFRSGQCHRNCSFVSGEASSVYALGFAIAMMARRRRAILMALAIFAGTVIGFIRIGQGGHFLSDIIFAGVLMAIVVALMHWLVFRLFVPGFAPENMDHNLPPGVR